MRTPKEEIRNQEQVKTALPLDEKGGVKMNNHFYPTGWNQDIPLDNLLEEIGVKTHPPPRKLSVGYLQHLTKHDLNEKILRKRIGKIVEELHREPTRIRDLTKIVLKLVFLIGEVLPSQAEFYQEIFNYLEREKEMSPLLHQTTTEPDVNSVPSF